MKTNYKWIVVAMLWFVCFFNYADRQAIFSVFEPIKGEMGLTGAQLGAVSASFMWVYALAAPLAGLVGDRFRRKTLILGGLIFWSLITVATAFSKNYTHLVICRALEGFGEAFYFPASMSLVSDYHGPDTRSRAMAIHQSSVYAGTIAGGSVAGVMADHFGWRSSFYLFGWFGVALGLVLLFFLKEPKRGQAEGVTNLNRLDLVAEMRAVLERQRARLLIPVYIGASVVTLVFVKTTANRILILGSLAAVGVLMLIKTPMVRVLILVFVGANFVAMIFLTWMPTYLKREFGMSLSMSGVRATAVGVMNAIGWLGGGAGTYAIGVAEPYFRMSVCLSANSLVYLLVGMLMIAGVRAYLNDKRLNQPKRHGANEFATEAQSHREKA